MPYTTPKTLYRNTFGKVDRSKHKITSQALAWGESKHAEAAYADQVEKAPAPPPITMGQLLTLLVGYGFHPGVMGGSGGTMSSTGDDPWAELDEQMAAWRRGGMTWDAWVAAMANAAEGGTRGGGPGGGGPGGGGGAVPVPPPPGDVEFIPTWAGPQGNYNRSLLAGLHLFSDALPPGGTSTDPSWQSRPVPGMTGALATELAEMSDSLLPTGDGGFFDWSGWQTNPGQNILPNQLSNHFFDTYEGSPGNSNWTWQAGVSWTSRRLDAAGYPNRVYMLGASYESDNLAGPGAGIDWVSWYAGGDFMGFGRNQNPGSDFHSFANYHFYLTGGLHIGGDDDGNGGISFGPYVKLDDIGEQGREDVGWTFRVVDLIPNYQPTWGGRRTSGSMIHPSRLPQYRGGVWVNPPPLYLNYTHDRP